MKGYPSPAAGALAALRANAPLWKRFVREDEYDAEIRDVYQRPHSHLSAHGPILEPSVSQFLLKNGLSPKWPKDAPFAVLLTHDIDVLFVPGTEVAVRAARALRKGKPRELAGSLRALRKARNPKSNPLWNFGEVMDRETAMGARSTFFFKALSSGQEDFNYTMEQVAPALKEIASRGFEIGLHGGHEAWRDEAALRREKMMLEKAIDRPATGYRNHYLRFQVPETWRSLVAAGVEWDSTYGDPYSVGFRNGMAHPFKPYDARASKFLDILEIPLTVMDGTLESYLRLGPEAGWSLTRKMLDTVENVSGVATLLWHNTHLTGPWAEVYWKAVDHARSRGAWMPTGSELARWWKAQRLDAWQSGD